MYIDHALDICTYLHFFCDNILNYHLGCVRFGSSSVPQHSSLCELWSLHALMTILSINYCAPQVYSRVNCFMLWPVCTVVTICKILVIIKWVFLTTNSLLHATYVQLYILQSMHTYSHVHMFINTYIVYCVLSLCTVVKSIGQTVSN